MVKILLVDDHFVVREGLKLSLSEETSLRVIEEASSGTEAIEVLESASPDVILMDINMPEMDGIEATRIIKDKYPHINVLMISMHNNERFVFECLEAGATGYILKNSKDDDLIKAIHLTANGQRYIDSEISLSQNIP